MKLDKSLFDRIRQPLSDLALFVVLILGFHFLFRFWAYHLHYWPVRFVVMPIYGVLVKLLFHNSVWALHHFTHYAFTTRGYKIIIGHGYVAIDPGCSSLKQSLEWIVLMVFFPGPWKHKLWFIPSGLVVVHLVNIFRISALSVLLLYMPEHWKFIHDWVLRPFFYVVIFAMWVLWVEKFRNVSKRKIKVKNV